MHSGFRGAHRAHVPVNPLDLPHDNTPDPFDDADLQLPDGKALVEAFMSGLVKEVDNEYRGLSQLLETLPDPSKSRAVAEAMSFREATSKGLVPEASEETLRAFSASEMKLYKHATSHRWTADELISTIKLIKSVDFNIDDVNVDLHKRVAAAIAQGHFTSHSMRESDRDGDQDLTFWLRSLEEVLKEVLGDERMAGHQHFSFEMSESEDGHREFGASNGAVSFQIAQIRCGEECVPVSLVIYIDGSFIKHGIPVKPIYGMYVVIYMVYTCCIIIILSVWFRYIYLICL